MAKTDRMAGCRRSVLWSLIAVVLAMVTASSEAQTGADRTVRIQDYPSVGNGLTRVAIGQQYCEKHGIKCALKSIPSAPLGVQALLAGDLDVAFAPVEVAIQAVAKGADLKTFGNGSAHLPFFLVVGNHLDTPRAARGYPALMADLKGKRVGVTARGSAAEFQFVNLLAGSGMAARDVTFVAAGAPNTSFPALANRQIDALMAFEPVGGYCEVLKACRIVLDLRKGEGPPELQKLRGAAVPYWVRGDYARQNPQVIAALRRAHQEAEGFVQNPARFADFLRIAQGFFRIEHEQGDAIFAAALRNTVPAYFFELDARALQAGMEYLVRTGQLDRPVDTSELVLGR